MKEAETGKRVEEVYQEYDISDATYCNWKAKYDAIEVSDVKQLKELEGKAVVLHTSIPNLAWIIRS